MEPVDKQVLNSQEFLITINHSHFTHQLHREFRNSYRDTDPSTTFRIDLAKVTYMDSSSLGMLLQLVHHVNKNPQQVILTNVSNAVLPIIRQAHFDRFFTFDQVIRPLQTETAQKGGTSYSRTIGEIKAVRKGEQLTIFTPKHLVFDDYKDFHDAYKDEPTNLYYIIDMSQTAHLDSAGLGILMHLRMHLGVDQSNITIINVSDTIRNLLEIVNFQRLFTIR